MPGSAHQLLVKALFLKLSGTSAPFPLYILGEGMHSTNSPTINGDLSCQCPEALGTVTSAFLLLFATPCGQASGHPGGSGCKLSLCANLTITAYHWVVFLSYTCRGGCPSLCGPSKAFQMYLQWGHHLEGHSEGPCNLASIIVGESFDRLSQGQVRS